VRLDHTLVANSLNCLANIKCLLHCCLPLTFQAASNAWDADYFHRRSQRLFVSHAYTRLHCANINEQIKMLFGVNTPGGPRNIVRRRTWSPPQRGEGGPLLNLGTTPSLGNGWRWPQIWSSGWGVAWLKSRTVSYSTACPVCRALFQRIFSWNQKLK